MRQCQTPTPIDTTPMITLNYVIFSNYYPCFIVGVHVVSGVLVCVRAS